MNGSFGIIFDKKRQKVLLVKRRDIPIWVLPGGIIETGENPKTAVIREVFEETGYLVDIVKQIGQYTYPDGKEIDFVYECKITGGNKTLSSESKAIEFFDTNNLPELIHPYDIVFIKDAVLCNAQIINKTLEKWPTKVWLKLIRHPIVLFKYLLIRIGIHWNT